jgi:hypothetical protein
LGSFFEQSELVNAYDVDINNKLKLNALFNFLRDVESTYSDSLKLGYNDLIINDPKIRFAHKGAKEKFDVIEEINMKTSKQVFQALVEWGINELK